MKTHRNSFKSCISNTSSGGATLRINENCFSQNFWSDNVEEWRKFWKKNAQKCVHKLNKQRTEWWRHLSNVSELFIAKKNSMEMTLKKDEEFGGKTHRNSSINWISTAANRMAPPSKFIWTVFTKKFRWRQCYRRLKTSRKNTPKFVY